MSVKFENMELKISLWDILNELTDEQKHEIAEHLIWDQAIFDDFVDRIATERVVTDSFNSNLYKARLRLIELLPQLHQEMIRSLLTELREARAQENRLTIWAYRLYHAWPDDRVKRPELDKYVHTPMASDEEVSAIAGS